MTSTDIQFQTCLFCGGTLRPRRSKRSGKTDEHIIARWLMDHLKIQGLDVSPVRVLTVSRQVIDLRRHPLQSLIAPVCRDCNNGWMSELENSVKPFLPRLIADPHSLSRLTPGERAILARWTFKTVAALNRASTHGRVGDNLARPVPDEHLRLIATDRLPDAVVVVGGGYPPARPFDWLQFATWSVPGSKVPLATRDRERSYKIAIGIGELLLAVAYYPSPEYVYGGVEGWHVPLWSGRRGLILVGQPIDQSLSGAGSPGMEQFVRNIFVVSKTWLELASNISTTRLVSAH